MQIKYPVNLSTKQTRKIWSKAKQNKEIEHYPKPTNQLQEILQMLKRKETCTKGATGVMQCGRIIMCSGRIIKLQKEY